MEYGAQDIEAAYYFRLGERLEDTSQRRSQATCFLLYTMTTGWLPVAVLRLSQPSNNNITAIGIHKFSVYTNSLNEGHG